MSVAQTTPVETSPVSPIVLVARRIVRAAMDALAALGFAADRRARAVEADALHDRALMQLVHVAGLGATEATIHGCRPCAVRFDRVIRLGQAAQHADAVEDSHYAVAFEQMANGQMRIRAVAGTADRLATEGGAR